MFPSMEKAAPAAISAATQPGRVFWLTGMSGAGKTTIARELWSRLQAAGYPAVFLDGDMLRVFMSEDLSYSTEHRRMSAMRNGKLCKMLAEQGIDVVCATISLFHDVQRWNRTNIPGYREIYLRVPMAELERRDPKGIYARARRGEIANVVGIDVAAETPEMPDLVLDNHTLMDPAAAVALIWRRFVEVESPVRSNERQTVRFGTKSETLEQLAPHLRHGQVMPQVRFTVAEWQSDRSIILGRIAASAWGTDELIVRSSAKDEDGAASSQAGKYDSISGVVGEEAMLLAVEKVIASFKNSGQPDDQVFVQPMLRDVVIAGVAFTRDPNGGGPYVVINYDDKSGRTDVVTSGGGTDLKTFFWLKTGRPKNLPNVIPKPLVPVCALLCELEALLDHDALDVEFAIGRDNTLYLLQVRPLATKIPASAGPDAVDAAVTDIARKIEVLNRPHPYLHGNRTVFGVMPDWNPAEIIGLKPQPLALTLYREIVTDAIWAYQRDNYGYKNLRSFPLMVSFHGLPYIDVRVSFNSFVPRDIGGDLAERLVNYYIERLVAQPDLHDKVEFEIIFSCYTLDFPERVGALRRHGFSEDDLATVTNSLRELTNRIINGQTGLWHQDREKIDLLGNRLRILRETQLDKVSRIYWLIEDCKRYGTLPFAGLARAGFIAVQLLRSLVSVGILDATEYAAFMANLDTVGSRIGRDFARLSKAEFLAQYGHLRPGTYDILSPRYDEAPELYFDWSGPRSPEQVAPRFALSVEQLRRIERLLKEHRLDHDVLGFIEFIKAGIEGREYAKFVFTQNLSDALSLIKQLGDEHGLSVDDCAFLDFAAVRALYHESSSIGTRLKESVAEGRRRHALTRSLVLPPVIVSPDDVFAFHLPPSQPNFITQKCVTAPVTTVADSSESLAGSILFVPSADPGFDWIFSRGIAGFVTQFGGVNSHMAIRAGELGVPAVIGAGAALFERWGAAKKIFLDCGNRHVELIT
jgi:adenylylsulfate kinase-like enzyme/phosphohistidine swiveling domain-containing protein